MRAPKHARQAFSCGGVGRLRSGCACKQGVCCKLCTLNAWSMPVAHAAGDRSRHSSWRQCSWHMRLLQATACIFTALGFSAACSTCINVRRLCDSPFAQVGSCGCRHGRLPYHAQQRRVAAAAEMKCLIFDCDGVILESEDLHRRAYNASFEQFNVTIGDPPQPVEWSSEYYDELSNTGAVFPRPSPSRTLTVHHISTQH